MVTTTDNGDGTYTHEIEPIDVDRAMVQYVLCLSQVCPPIAAALRQMIDGVARLAEGLVSGVGPIRMQYARMEQQRRIDQHMIRCARRRARKRKARR